MSKLILVSLLLLSLSAQALPAATADAKGIAGALPRPCALVVTAQTSPQKLLATLGSHYIQNLAADCGLTSEQLTESADGRAFLAVYDGEVVIALGLDTNLPATRLGRVRQGWLLVGEPAVLDLFEGEPATLGESPSFNHLAGHWPGGPLLLYSGDLWTPSARFAYEVSEFPEFADGIRELFGSRTCPQLCAGMAGTELEAWVAPLAPSLPAGETWSSRLQGDQFHRQSVPGLDEECSVLAQPLEGLLDLPLVLPLEWKLSLATWRGLQASEPSTSSLANALLPIVTGQRLRPTDFQETLRSQGEGLWVYRLDAKQTAELTQKLLDSLPGSLAALSRDWSSGP